MQLATLNASVEDLHLVVTDLLLNRDWSAGEFDPASDLSIASQLSRSKNVVCCVGHAATTMCRCGDVDATLPQNELCVVDQGNICEVLWSRNMGACWEIQDVFTEAEGVETRVVELHDLARMIWVSNLLQSIQHHVATLSSEVCGVMSTKVAVVGCVGREISTLLGDWCNVIWARQWS